MPRVLQVHDKPEGGGGIARVVADLGAGLAARGWDVVEVRLSRRAQAGAVATRPGPRAASGDPGVAAVATAAASSDAVILHLGYSLLTPDLIRAAAQASLFVQLHDVAPFCPNGLRLRWPGHSVCARTEGAACFLGLCAGRGGAMASARAVYRMKTRKAVWKALCTTATGFLAPSRYLANLATAHGALPDMVHHLPHPVTFLAETCTPESHAAVVTASAGDEIAYVGLLSEAKGVNLLLEAVALLPDARLAVYGDGPEAARLRARASRPDLEGRVRFCGAVDRSALRAGLTTARMLAHPSLVPEGLGLSGIEAMALGLPVVGFGRGGSADWLIDGKTGIVCAPNARALASGLGQLWNDPLLAQRMGKAARDHVATLFAPGPALDALSTRLWPSCGLRGTR